MNCLELIGKKPRSTYRRHKSQTLKSLSPKRGERKKKKTEAKLRKINLIREVMTGGAQFRDKN